jgi:SOS-response transcriptional repressor LexA
VIRSESNTNFVKFTHYFVGVCDYVSRMDDKWFKQQQKIAGVTADQIAQAIGRDRSLVSRVYTGRQKMTLDLAQAFADILQVPLATVLEKSGIASADALASADPSFADGDAMPVSPTTQIGRQADALTLALGGKNHNIELYRVQSHAMALAGMLLGDLILVDKNQSERITSGDMVLAKVYQRGGKSCTVLRRFEAPVLVSASMLPEDARVYVVDGETVSISGKVVACWRTK